MISKSKSGEVNDGWQGEIRNDPAHIGCVGVQEVGGNVEGRAQKSQHFVRERG